jgi:hypothetical protein
MRGIRLQSCRRIVNLDAVGFVCLFFHHCRVTELKSHPNHFFCAVTKIPMGWLCYRMIAGALAMRLRLCCRITPRNLRML